MYALFSSAKLGKLFHKSKYFLSFPPSFHFPLPSPPFRKELVVGRWSLAMFLHFSLRLTKSARLCTSSIFHHPLFLQLVDEVDGAFEGGSAGEDGADGVEARGEAEDMLLGGVEEGGHDVLPLVEDLDTLSRRLHIEAQLDVGAVGMRHHHGLALLREEAVARQLHVDEDGGVVAYQRYFNDISTIHQR